MGIARFADCGTSGADDAGVPSLIPIAGQCAPVTRLGSGWAKPAAAGNLAFNHTMMPSPSIPPIALKQASSATMLLGGQGDRAWVPLRCNGAAPTDYALPLSRGKLGNAVGACQEQGYVPQEKTD
jgi:hypothetical protein